MAVLLELTFDAVQIETCGLSCKNVNFKQSFQLTRLGVHASASHTAQDYLTGKLGIISKALVVQY